MTDFATPAKRHWEDAKFLHQDGRLHNADHHYGMAAECALKSMMKALGMSTTKKSMPRHPSYRQHVNKIWGEFSSLASTRTGAQYLAILSRFGQNPFDDWNVDQRYENDVENLSTNIERHGAAAKTALACLDLAFIDGVIDYD